DVRASLQDESSLEFYDRGRIQGWPKVCEYIPYMYFIHHPMSSFMGYVDLLGTTYSASTIATGYGSMIAIPLLRKAVEGRETTMTEEEGKALLVECMKVLFYRDARSLNKFQIATITEQGITIGESMEAQTEWAFADKIRGYGPQEQ
ncbi:unnamed protein product, partial [Rhizoctonia solani]